MPLLKKRNYAKSLLNIRSSFTIKSRLTKYDNTYIKLWIIIADKVLAITFQHYSENKRLNLENNFIGC